MQCAGVIFFGGPDIPPELYGQKMGLMTEVSDPVRHYLELSFIFHLLGGYQDEKFRPLLEGRHFAVLGICLGCQSLNVGTGGTLVQDIWSETYGKNTIEDVIALGKDNWHTNPLYRLDPSRGLFPDFLHPIKLDPKGFFCSRLGFLPNLTPTVLSAHHQQIKKPGKGTPGHRHVARRPGRRGRGARALPRRPGRPVPPRGRRPLRPELPDDVRA